MRNREIITWFIKTGSLQPNNWLWKNCANSERENQNWNVRYMPTNLNNKRWKKWSVQKLVNLRLYDMVLQFLKTLFLQTKNINYCTFRAGHLIALHDQKVLKAIHVFCYVKKRQLHVLEDVSMIFCDPYAISLLATSSIKILQRVIINNDRMQKKILLLSAWFMIDSHDSIEKNPILFSTQNYRDKYDPSLTNIMVIATLAKVCVLRSATRDFHIISILTLKFIVW